LEAIQDPPRRLHRRRAAASQDAAAKASAIKALLAFPAYAQDEPVARLLARLGDERAAFDVAARLAAEAYPGPFIFWYPEMRPVLDDPRFPALAQQLGLTHYWKQSKTRPDVCTGAAPPAFCRAI
jgi:hypothetical protein